MHGRQVSRETRADGSGDDVPLSHIAATHRQGGNPKLAAPPSSTSGCALT